MIYNVWFELWSWVPVQQQAAMMSQLPSNRQTMVAATAPTQPVYIIPQQQGATTMPHAPTVAFQPAAGQYGTYVCVCVCVCVFSMFLNFCTSRKVDICFTYQQVFLLDVSMSSYQRRPFTASCYINLCKTFNGD